MNLRTGLIALTLTLPTLGLSMEEQARAQQLAQENLKDEASDKSKDDSSSEEDKSPADKAADDADAADAQAAQFEALALAAEKNTREEYQRICQDLQTNQRAERELQDKITNKSRDLSNKEQSLEWLKGCMRPGSTFYTDFTGKKVYYADDKMKIEAEITKLNTELGELQAQKTIYTTTLGTIQKKYLELRNASEITRKQANEDKEKAKKAREHVTFLRQQESMSLMPTLPMFSLMDQNPFLSQSLDTPPLEPLGNDSFFGQTLESLSFNLDLTNSGNNGLYNPISLNHGMFNLHM